MMNTQIYKYIAAIHLPEGVRASYYEGPTTSRATANPNLRLREQESQIFANGFVPILRLCLLLHLFMEIFHISVCPALQLLIFPY